MTDPCQIHDFPSQTRVKAVLFDFDRTLVDLFTPQAFAKMAGHLVRFYERALDRGQGDDPAVELVEKAKVDGAGRPYSLWADVYQALVHVDIDRAEKLSRDVAAILSEHECASAAAKEAPPPPLPGVERALCWLEDGDVALATISTNCQPAVRTALHRAGLLGRFDVIVARTPELDMANLKPSPFPVELALDRLPCAPGDAILVGDSVLDMQAGQAAKVYTVGVPSSLASGEELAAAGAATVLDSMAGLKGAIGKELGPVRRP